MSERDEMDEFLTKREFHDAMAKFMAHLDKRFEAVDKRFEAMKTWFSQELTLQLSKTVAEAVGANNDQLERGIAGLDDKYEDLPERVTKLEEAAAKRQRRR